MLTYILPLKPTSLDFCAHRRLETLFHGIEEPCVSIQSICIEITDFNMGIHIIL